MTEYISGTRSFVAEEDTRSLTTGRRRLGLSHGNNMISPGNYPINIKWDTQGSRDDYNFIRDIAKGTTYINTISGPSDIKALNMETKSMEDAGFKRRFNDENFMTCLYIISRRLEQADWRKYDDQISRCSLYQEYTDRREKRIAFIKDTISKCIVYFLNDRFGTGTVSNLSFTHTPNEAEASIVIRICESVPNRPNTAGLSEWIGRKSLVSQPDGDPTPETKHIIYIRSDSVRPQVIFHEFSHLVGFFHTHMAPPIFSGFFLPDVVEPGASETSAILNQNSNNMYWVDPLSITNTGFTQVLTLEEQMAAGKKLTNRNGGLLGIGYLSVYDIAKLLVTYSNRSSIAASIHEAKEIFNRHKEPQLYRMLITSTQSYFTTESEKPDLIGLHNFEYGLPPNMETADENKNNSDELAKMFLCENNSDNTYINAQKKALGCRGWPKELRRKLQTDSTGIVLPKSYWNCVPSSRNPNRNNGNGEYDYCQDFITINDCDNSPFLDSNNDYRRCEVTWGYSDDVLNNNPKNFPTHPDYAPVLSNEEKCAQNLYSYNCNQYNDCHWDYDTQAGEASCREIDKVTKCINAVVQYSNCVPDEDPSLNLETCINCLDAEADSSNQNIITACGIDPRTGRQLDWTATELESLVSWCNTGRH